MPKYYSDLLELNPQDSHKLIQFKPEVVDKYLNQKGPWSAIINQIGQIDCILFWGWRSGYPVLLVRVNCPLGAGPAAGKRLAYLTDLANMPEGEQEHWRTHQA